jgi:hypothetical protein
VVAEVAAGGFAHGHQPRRRMTDSSSRSLSGGKGGFPLAIELVRTATDETSLSLLVRGAIGNGGDGEGRRGREGARRACGDVLPRWSH